MPLHPRREPVRAAILYSLEHYCYEDAVFLAERLYDEVGDVDSIYLLATCQYRSGRLKQARHLLSKLSPSCHAPSDLLHATICLNLDDPNGAVLALQSFLCFKESTEADIAAYYGSDAAIAFWLLGRSHRRLHNTREAVRHFRLCLKYNPFMWSAFEALSCMGEKVSPEECFTVSEYPPFLPALMEECPHTHSSHPPPSSIIPTSTTSPLTTAPDTRSENSVPMMVVDEKQTLITKKPSAFTPVDTNRVSYVTPDLFAEPGVGKAIASSTPVPRALAFTRGGDTDTEVVGVVTRGAVATGAGGGGGGCVDVESVRMVLDFGSGTRNSGGGGGAVDTSKERQETPMFGTFPLPPPSAGSVVPVFGTPSQLTPSPMSLPAHYTRQLLTAPGGPKKRVSHTVPPPAFKFSPTPEVQASKSDVAKLTNQISPSWSHDTFATPSQITPESGCPVVTTETKSSKMPLKSSLRRSERLRKTSMVAPQRSKVGISNLVHSNNASKYRFKTGVKEGERSPRKGSRPMSPRGLTSPRKSAPSFKTASSGVKCGEWEGGSGEVVTVSREAVRSAEQQAMASIGALMRLLQHVGAAYQCLRGYDLVNSLRCFRALPPRHRCSAWSLSHMARAYHTGERFREAAKLFREVHTMDPHRLDGMELFASCLWHLRCDVELSVVTDSLLTSDPRRVEAMCAKATSLNLAQDHEAAVKCLQRATMLSPRFPYAHTLLGHEYVMLKDFEKAMSSFQTAVSLDARHYNAWFGMAHVCFSQERYRLAEVYIRKALAVNKCSAICCTQLALIQFRQNSFVAALRLLDKASTLCHSNPIPRFHKAKVLESLGRYEEALQQLEELSHRWPKEPNIYISKGKLLKKLKRPHEAVLNFSWALDFSRHGGNSHIREEVDEMYQVNGTEGRNRDEDFLAHHSDSDREDGQQEEDESGGEDGD